MSLMPVSIQGSGLLHIELADCVRQAENKVLSSGFWVRSSEHVSLQTASAARPFRFASNSERRTQNSELLCSSRPLHPSRFSRQSRQAIFAFYPQCPISIDLLSKKVDNATHCV